MARNVIMDPNGTLSCVGIEEEGLPEELSDDNPDAKYLDVSFGKLRRFSHLEGFKELKALIADQNEVVTLDSFPVLEELHTLSLNKNQITDVKNIVRNAKQKFPKLAFLSLLGNPCCPSEMTGGTSKQYEEYRKTIIEGIRTVRFIDSRPVLDAERPNTVEVITDKKLRTGKISKEEHEHILKMHALIASLDEESTDQMLLSSDEDMDDEPSEYMETPEQEYFASILAAARGVAEGTAESETQDKEEIKAAEDLSVFEKIVSVSLPTAEKLPTPIPKRTAPPPPIQKEKSAPALLPKSPDGAEVGTVDEHGYGAEPLYDTRTTGHFTPLKDNTYDTATTAMQSPEMADDDRKLKIAHLMGDVRTITITKSPTGLDMHLVSDIGYIRVAKVAPNGAADKAGIKIGDVILAVGSNGVVGASEDDTEAFMLESDSTNLQIASLSMGLPAEGSKLQNKKYSVGAMSGLDSVRPLYCEIVLERRQDDTFGFTVNTNGPEPTVDTTEAEITSIKPGDVIRSIDGDDATKTNIYKLLKDADSPVNIDVIRYMVDVSSQSDGVSQERKSNALSNPGCKVFEAIFKGRSALAKKGGSKATEIAKKAEKDAKKKAKLAKKGSDNGTLVVSNTNSMAPGKIKLAVFTDSMSCKRMSKVPKALQQIRGQEEDLVVFEVTTTDVFTIIKRKRRLVIMVQSEMEGQAMCYILKFGKKRDCDRAAEYCVSLPGHVVYTPPKKLKKKKAKETVKSPISWPTIRSKTKSPNQAADQTKENAQAVTSPAEPRRRKLVRGANAIVAPVLPDFQLAMDALNELDIYLDGEVSKDKELAASSTHLSTSHISRAKSRKWFKEFAKEQVIAEQAIAEETEAQGDGPSRNESFVEETDDEDDDDDLDDLEADDSFFQALEEKRAQRAKDQEDRRIALQRKAAEVREQLDAQRAVELEMLALKKQEELQKEEDYKEYCTVGAERRLKELTFKFKWNGARPQFITDDDV